MTGYLYLSDCFVSQTLYELLPSSQKHNFKRKGFFLSMFGLWTAIEIFLLFSYSVDWLNPLHCSPKYQVILYILLRPTINTGPSLYTRNNPSCRSLLQAESSKHPFMSRYPSSKPRHHWCLIFCFSCTSLKLISVYMCLPGTWKQD